MASTRIVIPLVRKLKREGPRFKASLSNRVRPTTYLKNKMIL